MIAGMRIAKAELRRWLAASLIVTFAIANYAIQTHVHGVSANAHGATSVTSVLATHPSVPVDNDAQHCPLCQEYLASGSIIAPDASLIALPGLNSLVESPDLVASRADGMCQDCQIRGPPRA